MRRKVLTRVGLAVVVLVVAVVGSAGGFLYYEAHRIKTIKVRGLAPVAKPTASKPKPIENILLVGSTSRCAVESTNKNFSNFVQQCEAGVNGVNSDVVLVLRLDPNTGRVALLSIPRDTFVPDARSGGLYNKIDAALADGPSQLVTAITEDFGIPINHYVVLNFQTFANIVTALGGISMYFPTTVYDAQSGLYVDHTGCVHISGLEALALVRARHMQYNYDRQTKTWRGYDGSGDIGRIERVHLFLNALAKEIAARGLGNIGTDIALIDGIAPDLTVDSTLSTSAMIDLVRTFHSVDVSKAPELTVPVINDAVTYMYKGYDYGLVVFPSEPQDLNAIDHFMGFKAPGLALAPSEVSVSVVDGTGSPASTASTVAGLKALGFPVVGTGTETPVGPVSETTVFYNGAAHLAEAERVLASLSGAVVLGKGPTLDGADVTVVTGTAFRVDRPSASSSATTTTSTAPKGATSSSGPTTTTTPTTTSAPATTLATTTTSAPATTTTLAGGLPTSDGGALDPATPAARKIPAYDPRSCPTTSGG